MSELVIPFWYGMVWYGTFQYKTGIVWYKTGMVWYGTVWYSMVWYGTVWYGVTCWVALHLEGIEVEEYLVSGPGVYEPVALQGAVAWGPLYYTILQNCGQTTKIRIDTKI